MLANFTSAGMSSTAPCSIPPGTVEAGRQGLIWENLDPTLSPMVLATIRETLGYDNMTPVQAAVLPYFLKNKDVAVEAPTGSGKTLSFVVPIIEKCLGMECPLNKNEVGALIITPTRELAWQIVRLLEVFIKPIEATMQLSILCLIGGDNVSYDLNKMRQSGGNIVVATPGRLEFLISRVSDLKFKKLEILVLDEADRLMQFGFQSSIAQILSKLPKQRRTGVFSATLSREINDLVHTGLRNAVMVKLNVKGASLTAPSIIPNTLDNYVIRVESDAKFSLFVHLMKNQVKHSKIIVFFVTIASVSYFSTVMRKLKILPPEIELLALHGQVQQSRRMLIYDKFMHSSTGVLLTTDLCARGLDFENVEWVIQFETPQNPSHFIHRVGRTARIGRCGKAVLLLLPHEEAYIDLLHNQDVPIVDMPGFEDTIVSAPGSMASCEAVANMVDMSPILRELSLNDRDLLEKGTLAYISFVRAYKETYTRYICRLSQLDFGRLGYLFGLLKLPRMSEFNSDEVEFNSVSIDFSNIAYQDRGREKIRQEKLALAKEERKRERIAQELEKRQCKEKNIYGKTRSKVAGGVNKTLKNKDEDDDYDDFSCDLKILKKLKLGRISQEQYEEMSGLKSIEEECKERLTNSKPSSNKPMRGRKKTKR